MCCIVLMCLFCCHQNSETSPNVWMDIFRPFGIDKEPVIHHKTGRNLNSVVQLSIPRVIDAGRTPASMIVENRCADCHTVKFQPHVRGHFPLSVTPPSGAALTKTFQWFGSGSLAYREVIVSQDLLVALTDAKIKGTHFVPATVESQS